MRMKKEQLREFVLSNPDLLLKEPDLDHPDEDLAFIVKKQLTEFVLSNPDLIFKELDLDNPNYDALAVTIFNSSNLLCVVVSDLQECIENNFDQLQQRKSA